MDKQINKSKQPVKKQNKVIILLKQKIVANDTTIISSV